MIYMFYITAYVYSFFSSLQVEFSKVSPGEPFIIGIQNICINLITVITCFLCHAYIVFAVRELSTIEVG
jgi:hypothetical protein